MKHEAIKFNTKKQLSLSLKRLLEKKSFSKITISELASECGLNRKTFYYHFADIQQLLEWTLRQEAMEISTDYGRLNNFTDAVNFTVDYIYDNMQFLKNAYNTVGKTELTKLFYDHFCEMIKMSVSMHEKEHSITVSEHFSGFLCHFYGQALIGLVLEVLHSETFTDKKTISDYILLTLSVSIPEVLKAADNRDM